MVKRIVKVTYVLLVVAGILIPGLLFDLYPPALGIVIAAFLGAAALLGLRFGDWMTRRMYPK